MARKNKGRNRRRYRGGEIIHLSDGQIAIRWREKVLLNGSLTRKRRYETLGYIKDDEAELQLAQRLIEARSARAPVPIVLFKDHSERWIRDVLPTYKWGVQQDYAWNVRSVLSPWFGDYLVSAPTEMHPFLIRKEVVQQFIGEMTKQGLSPHTIHHRHEVLRVVLRSAGQWYSVLKDNPAVGTRLPSLKPKHQQWAFTLAETGKLFTHIKEPRARAALWLLVMTGVRRGEYLALRWENVDDVKRVIHVHQAFYRGHLDTPKTAAGIRDVPLQPYGLALLSEWKKKSPRTTPTDLVFGTRNGKPDRPENFLHRHVWPACDAMNIRRATYLTFRRTFATVFSNRGLIAKDLAAVLGHSEPMNYYEQCDVDSQRAVAAVVEADLVKLANLGQ